MGYTISTQNGSGIAHREHNIRNRKVIEKENEEFNHVDLNGKMEIWIDERERDAYKRLFGEAIDEYNKGQTRKCRQIHDYYNYVKGSKKLNTGYEMIAQVGNMTNHPGEETCHAILKEFVDGWSERNPKLVLIGAYYHADEITGPHVHIDYIPVGEGYENGPRLQASMRRALENMGFECNTHKDSALTRWNARENAELERICNEHGLEIEHPLTGEKHLSIKHYRLLREVENKTAELTQLYLEKEDLLKDYEKLQEREAELKKNYSSTLDKYEELEDELEAISSNIDETMLEEEEARRRNEEARQKAEEAEKQKKELEKELDANQSELERLRENINLHTQKLNGIKDDIEKRYKKLDKDNIELPHMQPGETATEYEQRIKDYIHDENVRNMHKEDILKQENKEQKLEIKELTSELMEFRNLLGDKDLHNMKKELRTIRAFRSGLERIERTEEIDSFADMFNKIVRDERDRVKALERKESERKDKDDKVSLSVAKPTSAASTPKKRKRRKEKDIEH